MRLAGSPPTAAVLAPRTMAAAAVSAAFLVGVLIGFAQAKGFALLLALLYFPIAITNLPLALALWVPIVFLARFAPLGLGPNAAAALILLAWLGTLARHGSSTLVALRDQAGRLAVVALVLVWLTLSLSWASNPGLAAEDLWRWWVAGAVFLIVTTTVSTPRQARMLTMAVVAGAVLSVLVTSLGTSFNAPTSALQSAADEQRRLGSVSGDPNFLAAGIVPAIVLVTGLMRGRKPLVNVGLVAVLAVLTLGLVATESRGGIVAAAAAIIGAMAFYRGRRVYVLVFVTFLVGVSAAWFSVSPDAWQRVSSSDTGGNGRSDLWRVALRMSGDHLLGGVGLNNFRERSGDYVQQPGKLEEVYLIVDRPHVAHNTYLQLLAETGIVGAALFIGFVAICLRSAWLAAERFDRDGDGDLAALARAVLVAGIAAVVGSFFISNGEDARVWILLALGPVLLGAARTASREKPATSRSLGNPAV